MESSPEDSLPPLRGFDSKGEPIGIVADAPPSETDDEEFRTPAASEQAGGYRLRSRNVKPSDRPRGRRHTVSSSSRVEPFPSSSRVRAALNRVRRLGYAGGESVSQDSLESRESLLWDSGAQNLEDPVANKRLWSSSTASTHFDVTVVKSESSSDDMTAIGIEISGRDLRDAGPSGLQTGGTRALQGEPEATGRSIDTASLLSTDTTVARNLPTPAPRTSRPSTPAAPGLQPRPTTPLLQHRPVIPPILSPRSLMQQHDDAQEMRTWDQRANRLMMDAEDKVLLYHGTKLPPSRLPVIQAIADELLEQLRNCHPHCSEERRQDMAATRKAITEVLQQLAEASHEVEWEASTRGSVSSGPSGRSTPLDRYLLAINNLEVPQQALGGARSRDHSGGRADPAGHQPAHPPGGGDQQAGKQPPQQAFGGARPRDRSGGRPDPSGHQSAHGNQQASGHPPTAGNHPQSDRPAMGPLPGAGRGRPPGGRDNSGNRARDNSGDHRRRRRSNSGSRDRRRAYDRSHSPLSTALELERQNVLFLLGLIREESLEDVRPAVLLDPDVLKELHDVRIPEVKSAIRDCRDAAGKYAARRGCDARLVRQAQAACENAYEWTRRVLARYRGDQYHLGGNTPSRKVTFTMFDPHGDVSVYEFFMRFEEWSTGYLSAEAKADLLFSEYLPKSLTDSYEELKVRRRDYHAMRAWLIDQYGMIKRFCDYRRFIRALTLIQ